MDGFEVECATPGATYWNEYVTANDAEQGRRYATLYAKDYPTREWRVRDRSTSAIVWSYVPIHRL